MEQDFIISEPQDNRDLLIHFSRQEYHSSGSIPSLARASWGCYTTVDSLKAVMKQLDIRGIREQHLKTRLKETIEQSTTSEKFDAIDPLGNEIGDGHDHDAESKDAYRTSGDEAQFLEALNHFESKDEVSQVLGETCTTGINLVVRIRVVVTESKNAVTARYENGVVTGWKIRLEQVEEDLVEDDENEQLTSTKKALAYPIWRVQTDRGRIDWLSGEELMLSVSRWKKWKQGCGYFELDSSFLAYRNNLGRFCGKAADAPYSSSPSFFAKIMMRKELELYPKLKARSHDNIWGGQSGARALWTNSMKDYAYDFPTVRQGLLSLETAFFELTGQFSEYLNVVDDVVIDGDRLLNDEQSAYEIELESIEKSVPGLWNSPFSRAVYIAIVNRSSTTGVLALALDLLVHNTLQYLQTHKLVSTRTSRSSFGTTERSGIANFAETSNTRRPLRATRRMNTWQQQQHNDEDEDAVGGDNDSDEDWR
jgi:Williams-Beuren syndrome DDT (WSD), D-TOX E motif